MGGITAPNTGVGIGQSWQNVTASRAVSTTYTNNTGKPIQVYILTNGSSNSTQFYVNGIGAGGGNTTSTSSTIYSIVPAGATYSLTAPVGIAYWAELS